MSSLCVKMLQPKMTKYIESTLTPIYILLKVHCNTIEHGKHVVVQGFHTQHFFFFSNLNKGITLFFLKEIIGPNTLG